MPPRNISVARTGVVVCQNSLAPRSKIRAAGEAHITPRNVTSSGWFPSKTRKSLGETAAVCRSEFVQPAAIKSAHNK